MVMQPELVFDDPRPRDVSEIVVKVKGRAHNGDDIFFAYWLDAYLPPNGVRGQIFVEPLDTFVKRNQQRGNRVRVL